MCRALGKDDCAAVVKPPGYFEEIKAYYAWNWGDGSTGSAGANTGVNFTGLVGVQAAITGYTQWCSCPTLLKDNDNEMPWISIGGGNNLGRFTATSLQAVIDDMHLIGESGYGGIVWDVEGGDGGLNELFKKAF